MRKINGFVAAPFTPMHPDGSLNTGLIPEYADFLKRNGLDGAFICGSSGEGALLTLEERKEVAEAWVKASRGRLKVIVHTGGTNLSDQILLAEHAQQTGAYAIATMSPVFLGPKRMEELGAFCTAVATAAPKLPFYYYHIPGLTGINLSVMDFIRFAEKEISNFTGVKYTHDNMYEFHQCFKYENQKYDLLHGLDETLLSGLAFGCTSGVGGTYNHCFSIYQEMKKSFDRGDLDRARELQQESHRFINILMKYRGNIVGGKRMMKFIGLDCGPNRLPLQSISDQEEVEIKSALEVIGFFDYCNR